MSTEVTFHSTTSDGYMYSKTDSNFSVARDAGTADGIDAVTDRLGVGLDYPNAAGDKYRFYRTYLYFDTSSIPDGATIIAAEIKLYAIGEYTIITPGFSLVLMKDTDETYPHDPLVVGDFDRAFYIGGGASSQSIYTGQSGYKTFTFNEVGKALWVNDTGTSKFVVMSSLDIGYTIPTTKMFTTLYSNEEGDGYWPELKLTYATQCTVTTGAATVILASGATGNGNVTDAGSETVTTRGVIWNDDGTDPVDWDSKDNFAAAVAGGTGAFTAEITGCDAETSYYYRAYATSWAEDVGPNGTSVGAAVQFTTTADSTILTVTTQAATDVAITTVTANGTIIEDAAHDVTAYGFVYKLSGDPGVPADPTTADNYTDEGAESSPAEGAFTSVNDPITGLTSASTYFIRAYATTSEDGTAYGALDVFYTGTETTATLYSSTSDGYIHCKGSYHTNWSTTWNMAHDSDGSAGGSYTSVDQDVTGDDIYAYVNAGTNAYNIYRGYLFFDTSGIPAGVTVISATLSLYIKGKYKADRDSSLVIQKGATGYPHDPLENTDYDYTEYSGSYGSLAYDDATISQYNDIVLDTGIIVAGGDTNLCVREGEYDVADSASGLGSDDYAGFIFYAAEKLTTYRPKLVVVYSVAQEPSFPLVNIGDAWVAPLNILVNIGDEWISYLDLDVNIGDAWVAPVE